MTTELWRDLETGHSGAADVSSDSILYYVLQPSHRMDGLSAASSPSGITPCCQAAHECALPLHRVEQLAGMGLTLREVLAALEHWAPLTHEDQAQIDGAFERGRAKGSARLKEAHYDVAIGGAVSAQKHLLDMLDDSPQRALKPPLRVIRKILE